MWIGQQGILRADSAVVIEDTGHRHVFKPKNVQYADVITRQPEMIFPTGEGQVRGLVITTPEKRYLAAIVDIPERTVVIDTLSSSRKLAAQLAIYQAGKRAREQRGASEAVFPFNWPERPDIVEPTSRTAIPPDRKKDSS